MEVLNYYSGSHLIFWYLIGRYSKIDWKSFLFLSISWEFLELVLPFKFASEIIENKIADIIINILGYYSGVFVFKKNDY